MNQEDYFAYLKRRSHIGLAYRRYWLYPSLSKYLPGTALDIGCGIGDFLAYRKQTVGVDINEFNVDWCRSQGHSVRLMKEDELPFPDNTFDSIIMDNVLEHIDEPRQILSEAHRVLTSGGVFVVGVPGTLGYSADSDHKVFYSREKLKKTMMDANFTVCKVFSMPANLKWLDKYISQYCEYGVFKKL